MEKVKLNNQIVSMRKYMKQAKVHVINKLVKQIKLLQNRKGSETQIQKAKRKADRFLEAVVIVKKIKPDDVSKLALSKAKDWKYILQQKNSTLHDRCIAMLANYGAVQKEVEAFYSANKELVLQISDYISQWEEKSKLPKDSPKSNKLSPMMKSNKNIQKTNLKNESLPSSSKSKLKTIVETKSDANKNGTALAVRNDGKLALEFGDSNNNVNEAKLAKKSNFKNLNKVTEKSDDLSIFENSSVEAEESDKSDQEGESDEKDEEEMNINSLNENNKDENSMEAEQLDGSDQESESDHNDEEKERNGNSLNISKKDKNNSMEEEELDNSDQESESDENDEEEKINGNSLNNNKEIKGSTDENSNINKTHKSVSKFDSQLQMNTGSKNKLKAIALLNLNELEGLDEIPVGNSFKNDESAEEESNEEINETFQNKCSDPFFLGHKKEDFLQNKSSDPFFLGHNKQNSLQNKSNDSFFLGHSKDFNPKELDNSSKDSDVYIRTKDSTHSFKHKAQTVKKSFCNRKDDQFSPKKSFQKSSYNHRNVPKRFKNEEYSAKSFKKDKFASTNYHNKFQERDFNKNRKDFKLKNKPFPPRDTYDKKQLKDISKGFRNKDNSISPKSKVPFKKGNTNESLHPSWEAKRKQKELLSTSFQGKRMVFND